MRAADSFSALPHFERGITTSAPGFFAPQGRVVGRLNNVLIPDLQERLAKIRIRRHLAIESEGSMRASNNEMETSALLRIAGEILGYRAGALCAVIANRAHGEFITPERYAHSVDSAIKVGLEALYLLG
jgi:uridine phosphorylase